MKAYAVTVDMDIINRLESFPSDLLYLEKQGLNLGMYLMLLSYLMLFICCLNQHCRPLLSFHCHVIHAFAVWCENLNEEDQEVMNMLNQIHAEKPQMQVLTGICADLLVVDPLTYHDEETMKSLS
jgi:hypothetical protein